MDGFWIAKQEISDGPGIFTLKLLYGDGFIETVQCQDSNKIFFDDLITPMEFYNHHLLLQTPEAIKASVPDWITVMRE